MTGLIDRVRRSRGCCCEVLNSTLGHSLGSDLSQIVDLRFAKFSNGINFKKMLIFNEALAINDLAWLKFYSWTRKQAQEFHGHSTITWLARFVDYQFHETLYYMENKAKNVLILLALKIYFLWSSASPSKNTQSSVAKCHSNVLPKSSSVDNF